MPGYPPEEERESEEDYDCYPQWHGDGDKKYKDRYAGDYYCQSPGKCKNTSGGSYPYDIRRGKENIKSISHQTSQKEYRQEVSFPYCPDEETPQEIQGYHIE